VNHVDAITLSKIKEPQYFTLYLIRHISVLCVTSVFDMIRPQIAK